MQLQPTLSEAKKIASEKKYKCLPVSTSILSDIRTPIEVLRILKGLSKHCYILESVSENEKWGRYTFLGFDPKLEVSCLDGQMSIVGSDETALSCLGGLTELRTDSPARELRRIMKNYKSPRLPYLPTFTGGLVGYFSYDYIKYAERSLSLCAKDDEDFRDMDLMLFDKVIAFDNFRQKIILIVNINLDDVEREYEKAKFELRHLIDIIQNGTPSEDKSGRLLSPLTPLFSKEQFCDMVDRAKRHITEGDIFQIVLSNRQMADYDGSLLNTYRLLRTTNPSPYMFYFSGTDVEVAGASPETLVKLTGDVLYTFPLAGTRPRGKDEAEDAALEAELLADQKELAEHNMLVDLGRNDIGKISRFGSVEVEKYHSIEKYSHVMHIGSTIRGIIREDLDAFDAINSILPAGTLSGAPKIRACQLIDELENNKRGIYGGAIGYIDFTGNLDTCIAIRIAYKKAGKVFVRSGAGIVADSDPQKEYQECANKAAAVVRSLEEGGSI